MIKSIKIRTAITAIICLVALYFLVPSFISEIPSPWNDYFPKEKIHLGLDLQGGMHLVLEVDAEKALEWQTNQKINSVACWQCFSSAELMEVRIRD